MVKNEKDLQKIFQEVLKACRQFHDVDTKFTNAVKEFYKLNENQTETLFDFDAIVDPMQYAVGKITWREFKRYVKKVLN